jgi:D-alanyl-D-alanine carboxypeptidase (penicillin-binding protein 5/6)
VFYIKQLGLVALVIAITLAVPLYAQNIETTAREAVLIDLNSQTVLFNKNADQKMPTSSMSKLMTSVIAFDALKNEKIKLDDMCTVSVRAWKMEGSRSFMQVGDKIKVEDLIRGIIIQSGNDASVILAECIAGSEEAFAQMMNNKAAEFGMNNSHFVNATGLPDPMHYSTANDLATLARHIIYDYAEYYHYYSEKEFLFNNIKQGNRNPLLYRNMGVDGLKTGHADEAGYGLTASAIRNDRRLILVANGLKNMQERADESARLLEIGFNEFELSEPFKKDHVVSDIKIVLGKDKIIQAIVSNKKKITVHKTLANQIKIEKKISNQLQAPIEKNAEVGSIVVKLGDSTLATYSLVADRTVEKLDFFPLMWAKFKFMISGKYDE